MGVYMCSTGQHIAFISVSPMQAFDCDCPNPHQAHKASVICAGAHRGDWHGCPDLTYHGANCSPRHTADCQAPCESCHVRQFFEGDTLVDLDLEAFIDLGDSRKPELRG